VAKTWYPVIDYSACLECGACVAKCPHGVYDTSKAPSPVVIRPESCVDHCHGCGNRCPVGAIAYVGEDTGWKPPNRVKNADEAYASRRRRGVAAAEKKLVVEFLYLDLQNCDRCRETAAALDEALMALTPALRLAGYEAEYKKIQMKTAELAKEYRFLSSPTIRVNGRDIFDTVEENGCGCCGEMSGRDVNCRVFEHEGERFESPPKELLAEGILRTIFGRPGNACSCEGYELPDNLRKFYEGVENKGACGCGGNRRT